MQGFLDGVLVGAAALGFALYVAKGYIAEYMGLVKSETFIRGSEEYDKFNALIAAGEVSLYTHQWSDEKTFSLSFKYSKEVDRNEERVENSIRATDLSASINELYDWAIQRGYIKE